MQCDLGAHINIHCVLFSNGQMARIKIPSDKTAVVARDGGREKRFMHSTWTPRTNEERKKARRYI